MNNPTYYLHQMTDVYISEFEYNGDSCKFKKPKISRNDKLMDALWYGIYGIPTLIMTFGFFIGLPFKGFSILFGGGI